MTKKDFQVDWVKLLAKHIGVKPSMHKTGNYFPHHSEFFSWAELVGEAMEKEAVRFRAAVPVIKMEPYAVAAGFNVETRIRCSAPGYRKASIRPEIRRNDYAKLVVWAMIPHLEVEHCSHIGRYAREVVWSEMMKEFSSKLQRQVRAALKLPTDQTEALKHIQANRERARESSRKAALVRLAECMKTFDYNEEDVLEAWRMNQITRVQEA